MTDFVPVCISLPMDELFSPLSSDDLIDYAQQQIDYNSLSKDELILLLHQRDADILKMQESISEYSNRINYLQQVRESQSKDKESLNPVPEQPEKDQKDKANLSRMLEISVGNGEQIRSLTIRMKELEQKVVRRNESIQHLQKLSDNQQEAIIDLNKWINDFIQTLNEEELTDDQRLLIDGYRIAFCGNDDNSDVENVLAMDNIIPTSALVSPRCPPSIEVVPSYSLLTFLHFIQMAMDMMTFTSSSTPIPENVTKEICESLSILVNRVCGFLEEGLNIQNWAPDQLYSHCPCCGVQFTRWNRKQ